MLAQKKEDANGKGKYVAQDIWISLKTHPAKSWDTLLHLIM